MKFKWEVISTEDFQLTKRAKIYGGWIINNNYYDEDLGQSESMVFVPDLHANWVID